MTIEKIWRGRVSRPITVKLLITKSSSERVNAMISPEKIPGIIPGSSTLKKVCVGVHPRSRAASVKD